VLDPHDQATWQAFAQVRRFFGEPYRPRRIVRHDRDFLGRHAFDLVFQGFHPRMIAAQAASPPQKKLEPNP